MKCPHCLIAFNDQQEAKDFDLHNDEDGNWKIERTRCPECKKFVMHLVNFRFGNMVVSRRMIRPKSAERHCPQEVPSHFADDFKESSLVLEDSPKASAALSRRCLQSLLKEEAKTKRRDLADQIIEVNTGSLLPSYLASDLDAVRSIGNFAAHPIKSEQTGEILPVEPGEAEWNLDVLEALFDFYFVSPAQNQRRKNALNEKLQEAGKPQLV